MFPQRIKDRWRDSQTRNVHRLTQPRFTDVRLLPAALCLWCFTALTFLCHFEVALLFLFFIALLLSLFYLSSICRTSRTTTPIGEGVGVCMAFALMLCFLQAITMTGKDYPAQLALLQEHNGQSIRFSGHVVSSEPATRGGYRTTVSTQHISRRLLTYDTSIDLHIYTDQIFVPGGSVTGVGTFQAQGSYYSVKGSLRYTGAPPIKPPIFLLKNELRENAIEQINPDNAGLVLGMAYGDDTSLTEPATNALRTSGLTHLTAVSGSNITLIFVLAYRLIHSLGLPRFVLIGAGLCATTAYVSVVGPDGSVLRAWTMGLLGAVGLLLGHGAYRLTMLSSCIIGLLFISPELATNYGFVLSVTATASLLLLAPAFSRLLCRILPLLCAELLALPLAASLWCAPVILLLSESIYPYTVLANVLVAPFVAPITLAGLGALIASSLRCPGWIIQFFLEGGAQAAQAVHWVSQWCYTLPGSQVPLEASPRNLFLATIAVAVISIIVVKADTWINTPKDPRTPALFASQGRNGA